MEIFKKAKLQNKHKFWEKHIQACANSGLSQREYCRQHSLALSSFGYWRRKIKNNITDEPRFYPLTIPTTPSSEAGTGTSIAFHLNEERFRIEVNEDFSPVLLKKLVTFLEQL